MWNRYAPVAIFPVATVIGIFVYKDIVNKSTPNRTMTVAEERDERILRELEGEKNEDGSTRYSKTLPKTVLDRNDFRKGARDSTLKVGD